MNLPVDKPIIYLISDGGTEPANFEIKKAAFLATLHIAVEAGIDLVQIREKKLTARLLYDLAAAAALVTRNSRTKLLVNGRPDIAFAAGADGVHLPADGLPANVVRRSFPAGFVIGISIHTIAEGVDAKRQDADFALFGPIFATPGKEVPQGVETLKETCTLLDPFPIIAVGGIDGANYHDVLQNGARGFAAIRFLNDAENLRRLGDAKTAHL